MKCHAISELDCAVTADMNDHDMPLVYYINPAFCAVVVCGACSVS